MNDNPQTAIAADAPIETNAGGRREPEDYAAVLTHVQRDAPERLACARDLARRFGAALIGLGAEAIPPIAAGPATGVVQAQWFTACNEAAEENLRVAREMFRAACAGLGAGGEWRQSLEVPIEVIARASRAADLIVASAPDGQGSIYRDARPSELALLTGRPVLVAPSREKTLSADRVVLAWKDTREARRAMADALPFFRRAKAVLVLEVAGRHLEDAQSRCADVVSALERHGVQAEPSAVAAMGRTDGEEILNQASAFGADLIVAGAYGHPRLGEMIFGGVTRTLLSQHDLFVLLSH
ncbi:MAG TPA: universal stress protein [Caulobacteraceae bacterium]|jgi:nucleotide-binding universal stress UspA family protein